MDGDVKRRPYESEWRREQAAQTRERVLDAADVLFRELGWEGTSVAAIAKAAGVSQETVYARFRNKRTVLAELVQRAVRGGDSRPVPEQPAPRALADASDAEELLDRFAADISARIERAAPLVAVVAAAARSEAELAELYTALHENRLSNLKVLVDALRKETSLRVTPKEALDAVFALTSPELHQVLVGPRDWSAKRYRAWLAATLKALLLPTR